MGRLKVLGIGLKNAETGDKRAGAGQHDMIIGPFMFDLHSRSLSRDGIQVALGGRALDVLVVLAAAAGETVSKDEMLVRVWPGLTVEENNLQVQISTLRKALGEGWIVTVPRRGYRLVVPNDTASAPPSDQFTGKPSIAVLPFVNMSAEAEQEYFADGMAEEIITTLSRYRSIFVIARNSSFTYKGRAADVRQIGQELGVRYLVEGSVRRDKSRIRIMSQLVDTETGSHIWAERFDRDLADLFAVQDEITQAIVAALAPAISHAERQRAMKRPPENLGAWEAYQRSLWYWSKQGSENLGAARKLLQQAAASIRGSARRTRCCRGSSFRRRHSALADRCLRASNWQKPRRGPPSNWTQTMLWVMRCWHGHSINRANWVLPWTRRRLRSASTPMIHGHR
jgi:TolB-like protein